MSSEKGRFNKEHGSSKVTSQNPKTRDGVVLEERERERECVCVCVVEYDNEDVESFEVASSSSRRRRERGEGEGRERADVRFTEQRYARVDYRCEETRNEWATVALESRKRRYACRISIGEKR